MSNKQVKRLKHDIERRRIFNNLVGNSIHCGWCHHLEAQQHSSNLSAYRCNKNRLPMSFVEFSGGPFDFVETETHNIVCNYYTPDETPWTKDQGQCIIQLPP